MSLEPANQRVVDLLKYDHKHPRLNDKIKRVLGKNHTPADQFKIKQEIVRLAKPCRRILDFRNKMAGIDIDQFAFHDMMHHLDQQSAQELKKEYQRYEETYTEGVHEHVERFFKENKQALIDAQAGLKANIQFTRFGRTIRNQEERMHLASAISFSKLKQPDQLIDEEFVLTGDKLTSPIKAVTSEISQTGLCIRTKLHLKAADMVAISFDALGKQLVFKQQHVLYQVIHAKLEGGSFKVELKLQEIASNQEFADYVKKLIYSHKHKYKVNLDSILETVRSKAHEQYYVTSNTALHLFFDQAATLSYCLTNPEESQLLDFFGPLNASYLPSLFEKDQLLEELHKHKQLFYLVKRTQTDANEYQYIGQVADNSALARAFFEQICSNNQGIVLKLTCSEWQTDTALQKTSVPDEAQAAYASKRIHRYSQRVGKIAQQLASMVSIQPISFSSAAAKLCHESIDLPAPTNVEAKPLTVVCVETQERRHEDRFELNTSIGFQYDGNHYRTKTRNLSVVGLAIEVGSKLNLPIGAELKVSFEEFVDRTSHFNLSTCLYKVVYSNDGLVGLSNRDDNRSDARTFWEKLILAKVDSFTLAGRENEPYGLNRALRNMASANNPDAVAFLNIKQNKPNILHIALPSTHLLWADTSKHTQHIFKTWFYAPGVVAPMMQLCRAFVSTNQAQRAIAFVAYKKGGPRAEIFHAILIGSADPQIAQLASLARVYQKRGCELAFFALELKRTKDENPRYYTDELYYLNRFAEHKCEKLCAEIRAVTALMSFVDISQLMLGTLLKTRA